MHLGLAQGALGAWAGPARQQGEFQALRPAAASSTKSLSRAGPEQTPKLVRKHWPCRRRLVPARVSHLKLDTWSVLYFEDSS